MDLLPVRKTFDQISFSDLSFSFEWLWWTSVIKNFGWFQLQNTTPHSKRNLLVPKTTYQRLFSWCPKKKFQVPCLIQEGRSIYDTYIYINIIINIMLKSHGFVPWFLVSADWWCLNIQFPSADWWDCQADSIPQQNDPSLSDWFRKFRYMGVSKNRGTPKCMVKIMEDPIKIDDLGVPLFSETSR